MAALEPFSHVALPPPPVAVVRRLAGLTAPVSDPSGLPDAAFTGPNRYANWLIPGRVLVGCFPCAEVWRVGGLIAVYRRPLKR